MQKKILLVSLLVCIFGSSSFAQTTQVTGQVLDSNGTPYSGASMKVQLVFNGTPVSNPTVTINVLSQCRANGFGSAPCQVPFTPSNGPFTLDPSGNIPGGGITLQDNTQVTPALTQWAFTTTESPGVPPPLGTGPQTCTATLTISGASQSVSSNFSGCPKLANISGTGGVDPAFIGASLPSVAGQAQFRQNNVVFSGAGASIAQAFPGPVNQGSSILCLGRWTTAATLTGFTDGGDTFTQVGTTKTTTSTFGASFSVVAFLATNVTGGNSVTVTMTLSAGGGTFLGFSCLELTPSTVDVQASATGASTALNSGNATTTNPQDSIFGLGFVNVACTGSGCTAGNGYTFVQGDTGLNTQLVESQVINATATLNATATATANADWAMFIVAMKGTPVTPVISNASGTGPFSLGTITGPLTPVQFKIAGGQITAGAAQMTINVTSGSITNGQFALESSIDGGTTWFTVPCYAKTFTGLIGSEQTPIYSAKCDLTGVMGETGTNFRFGPTQGFGISNLVVWGAI